MKKIYKLLVVAGVCLAGASTYAKQNNAMPAIISYLLSDSKFEAINYPKNNLLKTGQTLSYFDHDDGYYSTGVNRSYTRQSGMVRDNVTGLIWQDNSDVTNDLKRADWSSAKSYCASLTLGGYTDWRLPEIEELASLVSIDDKNTINPAFNYSSLSNGYRKIYWTNTINEKDESLTWIVDFESAKIRNDEENEKDSTNYVRCVRGDKYKPSVSLDRDNINNIVKDSVTGLMWQDDEKIRYVKKNQKKSIDYCATSNYAGYHDWRLPNINELMSIIDRDNRLTYNNAFINTKSTLWSSTASPANNHQALSIDFETGSNTDKRDSIHLGFMCVRGGKNISKPNYETTNITYKIATGQTRSYGVRGELITNGSLKDDGYYKKGLGRSYSRNNNIVTDKITGLQWQDDARAKSVKLAYKNGIKYCSDLILDGYDDWRLPDIIELNSISHYGRYHAYNSSTGAIDPIFKNVDFEEGYMTSSLDSKQYQYLKVDFDDSEIDFYTSLFLPISTSSVRCVRGAKISDQKLIPNRAYGVVYDPNTNLTWQDSDKSGENIRYTFIEGINYCENLQLANKSDWRLPNMNEIISISGIFWNYKFDGVFKNETDNYLSSTTSSENTWNSFYINTVGSNAYTKNSNRKNVRCVRDGKIQ